MTGSSLPNASERERRTEDGLNRESMAQEGSGNRDRIETPEYVCWVGEDGIVRFSYPEGTVLDLDFAKAAAAGFRDLVRDDPRPLLVSLGQAKSMTREARVFFSSIEGPSALGVVVESPIARVIGAMFMGLLRNAAYPARMFATEAEAVEWLKGYAEWSTRVGLRDTRSSNEDSRADKEAMR